MSKSLGKRSKAPGPGIWKEIKKKTDSGTEFGPLEFYDDYDDKKYYKPTCYPSDYYPHEYDYSKNYSQQHLEVKTTRNNKEEIHKKIPESTPINEHLSPSSLFSENSGFYSISRRSYKSQRSPSNYLYIPKCGCNSGETKIICIPRSSNVVPTPNTLNVHNGPSISISIPAPVPQSFPTNHNNTNNFSHQPPDLKVNNRTSKSNCTTQYNHCNFYCTTLPNKLSRTKKNMDCDSISAKASNANDFLQQQQRQQENPMLKNNYIKIDSQNHRPATVAENSTRKVYWKTCRARSTSPERKSRKFSSVGKNPKLFAENVQQKNDFQSFSLRENLSVHKSNSTTNVTAQNPENPENVKSKLLLPIEKIQNDKNSTQSQVNLMDIKNGKSLSSQLDENNNITQEESSKTINLKRTESKSNFNFNSKNRRNWRQTPDRKKSIQSSYQKSHPSLIANFIKQEQKQQNQSATKTDTNNLLTIDSFTAALVASIVQEKSQRSNVRKIRNRRRVSQKCTKNRRIRIRNGKSHPIYSEKNQTNSWIKTNINNNIISIHSNENSAFGQNDHVYNSDSYQNQELDVPSRLSSASAQVPNENTDKIDDDTNGILVQHSDKNLGAEIKVVDNDADEKVDKSNIDANLETKTELNSNRTIVFDEKQKKEEMLLKTDESDEPDYPPERFNYFTIKDQNYYTSLTVETKDFPSTSFDNKVILKTKSFDVLGKASVFNPKEGERMSNIPQNSESEFIEVNKESKFKSDSQFHASNVVQPTTNCKSCSQLISRTASKNSCETEALHQLKQYGQYGDTKITVENSDKCSVSSDSSDPSILKQFQRSKVKNGLKCRDNDKETFVVRKLLGLKRRHCVKHQHQHQYHQQPELIVMPMFPQFDPSDDQFKKIVIKKCGDTGKHKVIIYKDSRLGKSRISCRSQRHVSCMNCPNCGSGCQPQQQQPPTLPILCPPTSNPFPLNDYASILSSALQNAQQREAQVIFQMHQQQQQQQQQTNPVNPFNFGQQFGQFGGPLLDYENKNAPSFPYQTFQQQNVATPLLTPPASEIKTVNYPPSESNGRATTPKNTTKDNNSNPNSNPNPNSEQQRQQKDNQQAQTQAQAGTTTTHVSFVSPAASTADSVAQPVVNQMGVGGTTPTNPQGGVGMMNQMPNPMFNQMGGFSMGGAGMLAGGIGTPAGLGLGPGAANYAYPYWQPPLINEALTALAEAVMKERAREEAAAAVAQAKKNEEDEQECEDEDGGGINYKVGIPSEWCTFKSTPSCEMTGCQSCRCSSSPNPGSGCCCCCSSSPRRRIRKKTYTIEPNPLFWGNPKCASTFKSHLLGGSHNNNSNNNSEDIVNFGSGSKSNSNSGSPYSRKGNRNKSSSQSSSDSDMEDDSGGGGRGGTSKSRSNRNNRKNVGYQNQYQDSESGYVSKHDHSQNQNQNHSQSYAQEQFGTRSSSKKHSRTNSRHDFQDLNSAASHQNMNSFSTLSHFNPLQLPGAPSMDMRPYKLPPVDPFPFFRLPLPARPPRSATFDLNGVQSQSTVKEIHGETSKTFPSATSTSQNPNPNSNPIPSQSQSHSHDNIQSSTPIKTPSKTSTNTTASHHHHHHHHHHHKRQPHAGLGSGKTPEFADLPTKNMSNSPLHYSTHGQLEIHETSYNPTYIINGRRKSETENKPQDKPLSRQPLGLFGPATEDEMQALQAIGAIGQVEPNQVGSGGVIQGERGTSPAPVGPDGNIIIGTGIGLETGVGAGALSADQKEKPNENPTTTATATTETVQKVEKGNAKGVQVQAKPSMILLLDDCCSCEKVCPPNCGMRRRRSRTCMNKRRPLRGRFDTSVSSGEEDDCCYGMGRSPKPNECNMRQGTFMNQNRPMPPSCMKPCRKPKKVCCSPCPPGPGSGSVQLPPSSIRTPILSYPYPHPRKQTVSCRLRKKKSCQKDPSAEYFVDQQMTAQCFPHVYGGQSPPIYSPYSPAALSYVQHPHSHPHAYPHLQSTMSRGGVANLTVAPQLPPGYQAQIAAEFEAQLIPIVQAQMQMHRVFQNQCQAVASNIYGGYAGCNQPQKIKTSMDLYPPASELLYTQQQQQQSHQQEFPCASPMSMPMSMPMQYGNEEEDEDVEERGRGRRPQQGQGQGWHGYQVLTPPQQFQSNYRDYNMCSKSKTSSKRRVTGSRKC